ncbi:MAG: enoyl-CoA hydratase/isomerase family protein [Oligoflexia bacterium]|nr:enoyl-CoA hydratase/isomerase family protein [Oligoflexia bacterium]
MGDKIQLDFVDKFGWIWLNDTKGLNLMGSDFFQELNTALDQVDKKKDTLGLIICAREKNFSMGLDLKITMNAKPEDLVDATKTATQTFNRVAALSFPTLAIFKGLTVGGAIELTAGCDFRYATQDTRISVPAAKIGFVNPAGTCFRLARLIGLARAKELMMTSQLIDSQTALQWGLVTKVIDQNDMINAATAWSKIISSQEPRALQATKTLLDVSFENSLQSFLKLEEKEVLACCMREEPFIRMRNFWKK